jgi:hypothetical protein
MSFFSFFECKIRRFQIKLAKTIKIIAFLRNIFSNKIEKVCFFKKNFFHFKFLENLIFRKVFLKNVIFFLNF